MDYDRAWRPRNFRDTAESLKEACGHSRLKSGKLYRGGEFDVCFLEGQLECIGNPKTILNIRAQADRSDSFGKAKLRYEHIPTKNGPRDYETTDRNVKVWVRDVIAFVSSLKEEEYPLYVHCRSGKDRTGIIIGILLLILGVPLDIVVLEYLQSKEGKTSEAQIRKALEPYNTDLKLKNELKKCNLDNLCNVLLAK